MLTEAKFNVITCMLRGGAIDEDIITSMAINEKTLQKIKDSCGDYQKYKQLHGEMLKHIGKGRPKNNEQTSSDSVLHQHNITVQANHYMMEELQKQTKQLTLIGNKLTAIMEELGVMNK